MTFPNIATALSQGYSITKIIDWLMRHDKKLGSSIKEALNQGYTKDQIAEYDKQSGMSFGQKQGALAGMTEKEKADRLLYRRTGTENRIGNVLESAAKTVPFVAASAAAVPALGSVLRAVSPVALQMVANRFPRLAPLLGGMQAGPGAGPQPMGGAPGAPTITPGIPPQTPTPGAAQAIAPQPTAAPAPGAAAPQMPGIAQGASQAAAQLTGNISTIIKSAVQSGSKDPKTIVQIFETLYPGFPAKFEKENGTSLSGL